MWVFQHAIVHVSMCVCLVDPYKQRYQEVEATNFLSQKLKNRFLCSIQETSSHVLLIQLEHWLTTVAQ